MNGEAHRLAAILFADIVGYSLMPEGLALQLRKKMLSLVRQTLPGHRGRLVKNQGDDILAEFFSATDAIMFALALQEKIGEENASVGMGHRFRLRVGIHAGEVVAEGEDILGDAVNTAKRTESLAAPGGICLTESVWQQVLEQLPRPARRLGKIPLKHLKLPLVFRHLDPPGAGWGYRFGHRFRLALGRPGLIAGFLLLGGLILWSAIVLASLAQRLLPRSPSKLIEIAKDDLERYDKESYIQRAIDELARVPSTASEQFIEAGAYRAIAYWRLYRETGDLKMRGFAFNASSNVIANHGEDIPIAHLVQGLVAEDRGALLVASNELSRANALRKEEDGWVLIEMANVCRLLQDDPEAARYIQKALQVQRKPWYFYNELAKFEFAGGNFAAAVTNFMEAIRCASRNSLAECNLANAYLCLPDFTNHMKQAWGCLERARKQRPTAFYYHALGEYYRIEKRPDMALASFRQAAQLKPEDYRFWGDVGLTLKQMGKAREAVDVLRRAIDKAQPILDEDNKPCQVLALVGFYQAAGGDGTNALRTLLQALGKCPEDHQVRSCAGAAHDELGKGKEAEELQRLLDKH
ncbi:hypothetical protein SBV1_1860033 [Verrucomicrobia bacterium]|nr:hypothetical protein SBV1_1860033 [Verrucomicrobiota bacterium]